jgi:hypothetical protein
MDILNRKRVDSMASIEKELAISKVKGLMDDKWQELYNKGVSDSANVLRNMETVEYNIVTDEVEYINTFDDIMYVALKNIGKLKGISIENLYGEDVLTNEMLGEIRNLIVDYLTTATANTVDLSPPAKEYSLGDKVELYHDGVPAKATIIECGYGEYGLLIDGKYKLAYVQSNDSPTDYILALQKRINVE